VPHPLISKGAVPTAVNICAAPVFVFEIVRVLSFRRHPEANRSGSLARRISGCELFAFVALCRASKTLRNRARIYSCHTNAKNPGRQPQQISSRRQGAFRCSPAALPLTRNPLFLCVFALARHSDLALRERNLSAALSLPLLLIVVPSAFVFADRVRSAAALRHFN
jgi:hypothetical protein